MLKSWMSSQPRKTALTGALLLVVGLVLVVAVMNPEDTEFHLRRANNIIRRWRCPPGGFPAGPGRNNGGCVCGKCPKGYRCPGGLSPKVACYYGKYQDVEGQNVCKPAPRGTFVNRRGARRGTPCNYGTYNPNVGQRRCRRASPGYHVPARGRRYQTKCPRRTYQNQAGQRSCKPSPPGTFVNKVGQRHPTSCNYGSYQNLRGQTSCKRASPGYYVPHRRQSGQRRCPGNTYQHCSGQTRCIPCPRGLVAAPGSRRCTSASRPCGGNKNGVTYIPNKIVGCSGAFSGGVFGRQAKNLCNRAAGWQICSNVAQVRRLGLTPQLCASRSPANTFFGTQQGSSGNALCDNRGTNDVFGCGNGRLFAVPNQGSCTPFNKFVGSWTNPSSGWNCRGCHGYKEALLFRKGPGNGGVLCCKGR